jgi:hypothetical protein
MDSLTASDVAVVVAVSLGHEGGEERASGSLGVGDASASVPIACCVVNDQPVGNPKRKV